MLDSSFEGKLFINKILQYNKNVYSLDDYNVEEWSLYKTSGQFFSPQITLNTSKIVPFGKLYKNDIPIGFAQCQLRYDYVEGTVTTPVGYLEGIFIKEGYRNKGYAKELLSECEAWAKYNGCQEFASDCEIDNIHSFHFHKSNYFT